MLALHCFLPWSLPVFAIMVLLGAGGAQFAIYSHGPPPAEERRDSLVGLFVVLFCLAAATCWARGLFYAPSNKLDPIHGDDLIYHHWEDYFDHTAFTMQLLSDVHLRQYGDMEISDWPTPLYHYGSYLPVATLAAFCDLRAYDAVVALWTPLATFLCGLGAFVVAAYFGRRIAGGWAVVALMTIPDAGHYGLRSAYLSYHWLQQIGSGGLYGCACGSMAVVLLCEARRSRSLAALFLAGAFAAGTFFFKAQIFVVLGPLLLCWFLLCYPPGAIWWRLVIFVAVLAIGYALVMLNNIYNPEVPIGPDRKYFEAYCRYIASESRPGRLTDYVAQGADVVGWPAFYAAAIAMVLIGSVGVLVVALPVLTIWAWWVKKLHALDLMPWLALAVYVGFLVGLEDNKIRLISWELIHRPFVWCYFLLMVWCAGKFVMLLNADRWCPWWLQYAILTVAGLALLASPWHMGRHVQEGIVSWRLGWCDVQIKKGYVDCALYINRNSDRRDIVQDSRYDGVLCLVSQSERRCYLGRPTLMEMAKHKPTSAEVVRRHALMESVKNMTTVEELRQFAEETHIRWFVLHPENFPGDGEDPNQHYHWPAKILDKPAFESQGFAVYDFTKCLAPMP
jgi:hypothetical protein